MQETFAQILAVGGKSILGRAEEVIDIVIHDKSKLDELYDCLFEEDAWVRMRAADALEKVCHVQPQWLESYIDSFELELSSLTQPSIQWHLAQMYAQISLTESQKEFAIRWLTKLLSTTDVDWIVAANAMDTIVHFAKNDSLLSKEVVQLLKIQQGHTSKAVVKRATKLLEALS